MKHLKMLGLAAIAAMGLMAFVGAGTASATTLFTDSAKTIHYPAGTTVDLSMATGKSSLSKSGSTTIATCTGGTFHGKTANTTGERIQIKNENVTWTGCSQTTHTVSNGSLEIGWTSGTSGEVIGKATQWTYGIFGTSCTYGFGEGVKLGTLTGASAAALKINANVPRTAGGFLCPSTTTWEAEYVITVPHAIYIGS
ncbi:MAG: hypothetical protein M3335_09505 [Actinomycetota bacterium]|nr:hypothetical protein [Actinomycetota bacterium]